mmetsp:Transcript_32988/g.60425  ORF Transcript_32988/g.60425 Transcript_32988/m.60425 type:complete len:601 (+) Transcript_32988:99-1901(+)
MLRNGLLRRAGGAVRLPCEVPLPDESRWALGFRWPQFSWWPLPQWNLWGSKTLASVQSSATTMSLQQVVAEEQAKPKALPAETTAVQRRVVPVQLMADDVKVFELAFHTPIKAPADCLKDALAAESRQVEEQAFEDCLLRGGEVIKKKQELLQKHRDILGRGLVASEFEELHRGWKELIALNEDSKEQKSRRDVASSTWTLSLMESYSRQVKTNGFAEWSSQDHEQTSWAKYFQEFLQDVEPKEDEDEMHQKRESLMEAFPDEASIDEWVLGMAQRIDNALSSLGIEPAAVEAAIRKAEMATKASEPPHGSLQARSSTPSQTEPGYRLVPEEEALELIQDVGKLKHFLRSIENGEEVWFPDSLDKATRGKYHKKIGVLKQPFLLETWRGAAAGDRLVLWRKGGTSAAAPKDTPQSGTIFEPQFLRLQGLATQQLSEAASRTIVDIVLLELCRRAKLVVTMEAMLTSPEFPRACSDYLLQPPTSSPFRQYKLGAVEVKRCKSTCWASSLAQAVMQNCLQLMNIQLQNSELVKEGGGTHAKIAVLPLVGVVTDGRRWVCTRLDRDKLRIFPAIDLTSSDQLYRLLERLATIFKKQQAQLHLS